MAYWLLKSEPGTWSWADQVAVGAVGTAWDGVRNWQAAANLKTVGPGDLCFFYHSVREKQIVGIVEITAPYHPDPTDPSGRFGMVRVRAVRPLVTPVTLARIRTEPRLANLALVRQARLSVMPVAPEDWALLCALGGIDPT